MGATTETNNNFAVTRTTKERVPALPFFAFKEAILGKHYELSIVIVGDKRARSLNERYRKRSYVPNVLSFPLDDSHGEIVLNLKEAKRQHRKRGESYDYFVALLVVHAMLHLKGFHHGGTMESEEQKLLSKFKVRNTSA